MSESRETFFECFATVAGEPRTAVLRAWDAEQARAAFQDLLRAEGVSELGRVTVRRPRLVSAAPDEHPGP